jgi:hypothetical protein
VARLLVSRRRRYRDLIAGHVSVLGGHAALSEAQLSLVKRASAIECELEQLKGKLSMGEQVDLDRFTRAEGAFWKRWPPSPRH